MHDDLGKPGKRAEEAVPDPRGQALARGVFKPFDLVQVIVVQELQDGLEPADQVGKVHDPTSGVVYGALDVQHHPERMAVQPRTFVVFRDIGQPVSSLERELLEYFHLRDPQVFMGLKAEAPAGVLEAVLDCEGGVGFSLGAVHRLEEEVVEAQVLDLGGAQGFLREHEL